MVEAPCLEDMKKISEGMREAFGLQLLGVDVIIDAKTGKHGIIDVNAFPGGSDLCKLFFACCEHEHLYNNNAILLVIVFQGMKGFPIFLRCFAH